MARYAIELNGVQLNHVVFIGNPANSLHRPRDIIPMTFSTLKAATEIAEALDATVIDLAA